MSELKAPCWIRWNQPFPHPDLWPEDDLVVVGGTLSTSRLLSAYASGLFPMFDDDEQVVLWWSPDPRAVLFPDAMRLSRSFKKRLRRNEYQVTVNQAFEAVISNCAQPRAGSRATWITRNMQRAYIELHRQGFAHSCETWFDGELVGGLYGVAVSGVFSGESLFSRRSDASKCALLHLCEQLPKLGCSLIDCQFRSDFLASLGASEMSRAAYLTRLKDHYKTRRRRFP